MQAEGGTRTRAQELGQSGLRGAEGVLGEP